MSFKLSNDNTAEKKTATQFCPLSPCRNNTIDVEWINTYSYFYANVT